MIILKKRAIKDIPKKNHQTGTFYQNAIVANYTVVPTYLLACLRHASLEIINVGE